MKEKEAEGQSILHLWEEYRRMVWPADLTENQLSVMRQSFYAGILAFMSEIGAKPTETYWINARLEVEVFIGQLIHQSRAAKADKAKTN